MLELRAYQKSAIQALYSTWREGKAKHLLVVAPTGSGKSLMLSQLIKDITEKGGRVLVLCHRKELIEQDAATIFKLAGIRCGIYSAGLFRKETSEAVTVAGIQSIGSKAYSVGPFSVIIVDEAHLIPRKSETLYKKFLDESLKANPKLKIVGFTATPFRLDSGYLHEGKNAIFDAIAYEIAIPDLIKEGYLSPVISKRGLGTIDTSGLHVRGGEYIPTELASAAEDIDLVRKACAEIVECGKDRKGWLIFASSIKHGEMIEAEIKGHGIKCQFVTGETLDSERSMAVRAFKAQELRCLININVFTTGFDAPHTDLIACLRPTKSASLYVQVVGRGMRPSPGKTDCLLLDYGGVVLEHGPIDAVHVGSKRAGSGEGEAPAKECPKCRALLHPAVRECPDCGYQFPEPDIAKHDTRAYSGAVLSDQIEDEVVDVTDVSYDLHKKEGKPDSVRVSYRSGFWKTYREWLCPEHPGIPRQKFLARWKETGVGPIPRTAADLLERSGDMTDPVQIIIRQIPGSKYTEIKKVIYSESSECPF
jgi:DNA repair protein RadD